MSKVIVAVIVTFMRPVTIESVLPDGKTQTDTYGKGTQRVDGVHKDNWYLAALVKDGDAILGGEIEGEAPAPSGDLADLLKGNVGEVKGKLEAAELDLEQLRDLTDLETAGKARAGVLEALKALAEAKA